MFEGSVMRGHQVCHDLGDFELTGHCWSIFESPYVQRYEVQLFGQ